MLIQTLSTYTYSRPKLIFSTNGWNATRGSGYEAPRYIISYLMEGVYSQQSRKVNYENFPTAPRKLVIEEGNLELVGGGRDF